MARKQPLATTQEVADYLQVSERTLDDWAYRGRGPRFSHAGQQRRYRWEDVEKYLTERSRGGTITSGRIA